MSEYATSIDASTSYRPKGYGISPGLQRARRQFMFRNAVTGIAVTSFVVGIWAYSISAVKQDVFDDVDEQARALNALTNDLPGPSTRIAGPASVTAGHVFPEKQASAVLDANTFDYPRGIICSALSDRYPSLVEPTRKTLVWGAPPVDRIGRISDTVSVTWKNRP